MSNNTIAQYAIYVRDNSRNLVGQVDQYNQFEYVARFNAVGAWSLDVDADTPMAGYLATRGYGIMVNRAILDAETGVVTSSSVLMSGPIRGWSRQMQDNKLVVSGLDDLCWLSMRQAWPITGSPNYSAQVLAVPNLVRYYKLAETSGSTATDSSASAQNGTYFNSPTLAQTALIDASSSNHAVSFAPASSNMQFPTTSLPTGNGALSLAVWGQLSSLPGSAAVPIYYGVNPAGTAKEALYVQVNSDGTVVGAVDGSNQTPATSDALSLGVPHLFVVTWDGTTLTCYVDGEATGDVAPGALSLTAGQARLSGVGGGGSYWPGILDEALVVSRALTAAEVAALFAEGVSRFGTGAYDTQSGAAETVMRHYVDVNCVSATTSDMQGLSRVVTGLTLAADGGHGSTVKGNARFTPLVNKDGTGLLQQLALSSSPALGFTVTQSGTSLVYSAYVPADKTGAIIFSQELGNLADFTYAVDAPDSDAGGNITIVGGGGEATQRVIVERADTGSVTDWGRAEMFSDARDTSDLLTLQQRGDADLAQASETVSFGAVLAPTESMVYGRDFGLGDTVTVVVDGVAFTDIVREVDIALTPDGAETVTPAIGTPFNASPKDALMKLAAQLRAARAQIARLQKAQ